MKKNLWLEKFKEIINDKINDCFHYINEYKKVSYAVYTTNCLIDMIQLNKTGRFFTEYHICRFNPYFLIDDLINILPKDHPVFIKIKDDNCIKKYINISIGDEGTIGYNSYEKPDDEHSEMIEILNGKYNDKNVIISLFTKILYYYIINIY